MANVKISQLPLYTGNTDGTYMIINNSGETTTYKMNVSGITQVFACGSFYNSTSGETFTSGVTYTLGFDTTSISSGVTLSGTSGFTVSNTGVYNITSMQYINRIGAVIISQVFAVWLRVNGIDITNSGCNSSVRDEQQKAQVWQLYLNSGDIINIMFKSEYQNYTRESEQAYNVTGVYQRPTIIINQVA
jgi:hypothetical protein